MKQFSFILDVTFADGHSETITHGTRFNSMNDVVREITQTLGNIWINAPTIKVNQASILDRNNNVLLSGTVNVVLVHWEFAKKLFLPTKTNRALEKLVADSKYEFAV